MKKRFQKSKIYGIFVRTEDGTLLGYTEQSLCMTWEKNYVRAWRSSEDAQRIFEGLTKGDYKKSKFDLCKTPKKEDIFIARLGSKECPVSISEWTPMKSQNGRGLKFSWRNALFTLKNTI